MTIEEEKTILNYFNKTSVQSVQFGKTLDFKLSWPLQKVSVGGVCVMWVCEPILV